MSTAGCVDDYDLTKQQRVVTLELRNQPILVWLEYRCWIGIALNEQRLALSVDAMENREVRTNWSRPDVHASYFGGRRGTGFT